MAVDLPPLSDLRPVAGVSIATCASGAGYKDRDDLTIFKLAPGTANAALFTTNAFAAAPVQIARKHLNYQPRYWLINAGNANAATGSRGIAAAIQSCKYLAEVVGITPEQVLPFSTGVIGVDLPLEPFRNSMPKLLNQLSARHWHKAAGAIMTTDTQAKGVSITCPWGQKSFTINGIVKGAGMIHPNMATMLAFLATDIKSSSSLLQACLREAVDNSFHHISVDGDTSTNDSVALAATAMSDLVSIDDDHKLRILFQEQLSNVCRSLAEAVIRDAEGASRFVNISVRGASDRQEANKLAKIIARSPLIKTALFAGDPNWGRIICAIGYAEIEGLDTDKINLTVNELPLVINGTLAPQYTEEHGLQAFSHHDIEMIIELGMGTADGYCLTSDLSYDYVKINAEYRS